MKKLSDVSVVLYKGYYYLNTKVEGIWYLGRPCTKLGWIVYSVKEDKMAKLKVAKEKNWTYQGKPMPPFTNQEVETFFSLKPKKLKALLEFTKNKPNYIN
jgi:hypothetical protein